MLDMHCYLANANQILKNSIRNNGKIVKANARLCIVTILYNNKNALKKHLKKN